MHVALVCDVWFFLFVETWGVCEQISQATCDKERNHATIFGQEVTYFIKLDLFNASFVLQLHESVF